jgi:transcriptional antiterminator RfaH
LDQYSRSNIIDNSRPETLAWYLVHTKPRAEYISQNSLLVKGVNTYLPRLYTRKKGNVEINSTPLFPGYLFFHLDLGSELWGYIRWAPGISYVLKNEAGPVMVPDELVENIKVRESQHWNKLLSDMIRPLRKDDSVRITDGPFSGLEAVFEKPLSASGRVQVLIEILGQTTRVSLNSNSLARID